MNGSTAHRRAFEAYYGLDVPGDLVVRHDCDVPLCCNPAHLRIGTPADNQRDAVVRGRKGKKLRPETVLEVYHSKEPCRAVAARLGVSRTLVQFIRTGERWGHITGKQYTGPRKVGRPPSGAP